MVGNVSRLACAFSLVLKIQGKTMAKPSDTKCSEAIQNYYNHVPCSKRQHIWSSPGTPGPGPNSKCSKTVESHMFMVRVNFSRERENCGKQFKAQQY